VPSSSFPLSVQTGVPEPHAVTPVRHGFVGSHAAAATQALQTPPPQTRSVPQLAPSGTLVTVSTQTDTPVAHDVAPTWHASAGTHGAFATHAEHTPPLQTAPSPQSVPFGSCSDSVQTGAPVSHVVVAVVHGFGDTQAAPASHAVHVPPPQMRSSPQLAPFSTFTPVSTQTETPVPQDVRPTWHGFAAGVQGRSARHALQAPALQTASVPQLVPSGTLAPVSSQTDPPVAHDVAPTWHGFAAGVQATAAVQATHAPPLQTWSVPHVVPSGAGPVSVHTAGPVSQVIAASWQGVAEGQEIPGVQLRNSQLAVTAPRAPQSMV
jgi:hypothetical protein